MEWANVLPSAAFGGVVGFVSARIQDYLSRRRRYRTLAGILLAEVARVGAQLGAPEPVVKDFDMAGISPTPPEIHSWMQRIVIDAGDLDPAIVYHFLELDRHLANYASTFLRLRDARNAEPSGGEETESPPEPAAADSDDRPISLFDFLQIIAADLRRAAWQELDTLNALLSRYAPSPVQKKTDRG
jgi:hypothetical protein